MKPNYPIRDGYKSVGFGYASDMMAIAVHHDDAVRFMEYVKEVGIDCEVLLAGDLANYAALHGASECVRALFVARATGWKFPIAHYLDLAAKPVYGPNAMRKVMEAA